MNELALFAGAGGGILGGKLLRWKTVCAVEIHEYNQAVLAARQNDGCLAPFPIWDDVRTFTKRNGAVRRAIRALRRIRHKLVITGGFPCQDISSAGNGEGIEGERSGLWGEFARIIREVGPYYALLENSAMLTSRGLGRVLGDLAAMGYNAKWGVLGAEDAIWALGDPCLDHERKRIWIVATLSDAARNRRSKCRSGDNGRSTFEKTGKGGRHESGRMDPDNGTQSVAYSSPDSLCDRRSKGRTECNQVQGLAEPSGICGSLPDTLRDGWEQMVQSDGSREKGQRQQCEASTRAGGWWSTEPDVDRMAHGVGHRVDRLYGIGNGQVPAVVRLAWETLKPQISY